MQNLDQDVVIVGAGPAGLSAAQMLGRARRRTLVLDSDSPRNRFAEHMHAVVGFDGTSPAELRRRGREEAERYGVVFRSARVAAVTEIDGGLEVALAGGGERITTRALLVATGVSDRMPDVPGLAERWGRTVLHCPYCHGWEVRDRRIGVLATSPMSLHQIELVRQWSPEVVAFTAAAGDLGDDVRERLRARGIRTVGSPVVAVTGAAGPAAAAGGGDDADDTAIGAVVTADGQRIPVDAIFTGGRLEPHDGFLAGLGLARSDGPAGSFIAVDAAGATSHPLVWAAGNVVAPMANVPLSMGAGSMTGAAVNAALVALDAAAAVERRRGHAADWEARYAETDRVWSGRVNETTSTIIAELEAAGSLTPTTALDLGCGEGGDALWLASRGWSVTGVDLSPTAVARARAAARNAQLDATFVAGEIDAAELGEFDLVTTSFLHSWDPEFSRIPLLRAALRHVAPGGRLLVVSHASGPPAEPGVPDAHEHPPFPTPAEERAALDLDPAEWVVEREEVIERREIRERRAPAASSPAASRPPHLLDGVLLLRRLP
ncbi:bifunctional NAD(P)/FAD-dependent oxidoreductase/class I SAM-dependent methyltransferase [Microbacterium arborescens]|uniref:bifunctional NAD(P)/FAD-dependent oxidoreductase/class I SAM-dependent methyltransferase n=1 Tax=Microbacterium arborescens TaxID=33883 RepID=UPI0027852161|nr:bifunctional NAD(P)/FAD-dependent oxidoreductase/class I SAM-dependent methyltransferase [Microbacterium arborescens]MDQ1217093.1 thioredoxin reductase/SAM-dependent methyltransferase [Microbacterium arborescens]